LHGDLNSPGLLVCNSAKGGEAFMGFVQCWLDWPCARCRAGDGWAGRPLHALPAHPPSFTCVSNDSQNHPKLYALSPATV